MALVLKLAVVYVAVLVNLIPAQGIINPDLAERNLNGLQKEKRGVIGNPPLLSERNLNGLDEVKRGVAGPSPQNTNYLNEFNEGKQVYFGNAPLAERNLDGLDEMKRSVIGNPPLPFRRILDEPNEGKTGKLPVVEKADNH
ncbi:uncharacterized protein [Magallana gigas]|uniref:uncharacterized protein isoform X2 n=1 Tax=Magallana gigas TaxID=29159 RepID=UPI00333E6C0F